MPYPDKAFRRNMHKETADEFNPIQSQFFPLAASFVILYFYGHCSFVYAQDTAVAYRYPVCVTSEVIHYSFCWGKTAAGYPGQLDYLPSPQTSMPLLSNVSNGLLILMRALKIICRYTSVEFGLRCPNNCWINVWLTPSSSV